VIEQLPSEVFIRWIILLSRVFLTYRPTPRQVKRAWLDCMKVEHHRSTCRAAAVFPRPLNSLICTANHLRRTLRIEPAAILRDE
jgi:hypothetical protein